MQLNTLNRVISLFLIGGFVVFLSAILLREDIAGKVQKFASQHSFGPGWAPTAGVFLAVGLLSATALAGAAVDAIGNLTVRRLIRKVLAKRRYLARLFLCTGEFDEQNRWRNAFKAALEGCEKHKSIAERDNMLNPLSAGLFLRTAGKEHAEWLTQHHSMYHLSADFVVVLLITAIFSWLRDLPNLTFGSIAAAYLLTTFALDNYLYTYQLSFRNAYLELKGESEQTPGGSLSGNPVPNPRPQPDATADAVPRG